MKEIKIYSPINNESIFGWGERGYIDRLANEIKSIPDGEELVIRLDTPGGGVSAGMALISHISEHKGSVKTIVDGTAASMGAVIMAFSNEAVAKSHSEIMLHRAYYPGYSDDDLTDEMRNKLSRTNSNIAERFKSRGADNELIDEIFADGNKKNYWFTADEALSVGLIDKVETVDIPERQAASEDEKNKMVNTFGWMNSKNINYSEIKGETKMFGKDEMKQELQDIKNSLNEALELKNEFNSAVEKGEKELTEVNEKIENSIKEVNDRVEKLENSIKENSDKVAKVEKLIAALTTEIQNTSSDFKPPEIDETTSAKIVPAPSASQIRKEIQKEINNRGK